MRRSEVIERLKEAEPAIRARGGEALYLFGSHARDEAGPDSDIDVFIDKDRSRNFGFDEFMDIYFLLRERLGDRVDYGTREGPSPALRSEIEQEAIQVFLMAARLPRVWLRDIREEIAGIRGLMKDADLGAFSASWGMKRAVERALLIIAEVKDARLEVPWSKIHGLGNLLRHQYRHIDPEVLWSIVTAQLDQLDNATAALLENLSDAGSRDA